MVTILNSQMEGGRSMLEHRQTDRQTQLRNTRVYRSPYPVQVRYVCVTYVVLRFYVCPPIQEEGDSGIATIASSLMEGGPSILPQGHTDRQTQIRDTGTDTL